MAFFGSIGKALNKVIHNKAFQVAFPVVAAGNLIASKAPRMFSHGVDALMHRIDHVGATQAPAQPPTVDYHLQQLQPIPGPYYSGGYSQWDYSMPSPVYSTPTQGVRWEQLPGW